MASKEYSICEGIKWVDVTEPTMHEMTELSERFRLNQHVVRDCMEPDHLPKYDVVDHVHFLILRFFSHSFDKRIATIQDITNKIAVFYNGDFLITIHRADVAFLDSIRKKYVDKGCCSSPAEVVVKILWNTLDTFDAPAQRLSEQIDFHEKNIMIRKISIDQMEALYYIKRQASISHKLIMLMQEPINHIHSIPRDDAALQDVHDEHLKIKTLYNQVFEDVNNLMSLYMSFSAQKTNDVMKILTIFSVFFMPLTFIVGIYGMNFHYMPELSQKWGYPAVLFLMVLITVVVYLWFKRKRWL